MEFDGDLSIIERKVGFVGQALWALLKCDLLAKWWADPTNLILHYFRFSK
jgi:hypothetical protein